MEWAGKRVAVIGFGREGHAVVRYLLSKKAVVTVCDVREIVATEPAAQTVKELVTWKLGSGYLDGLGSFDCIMRSPGVRITPEIKAAVAAGVKLTSPTAEFFEMCPANIIGVTGTKGKGTTASLIAEIIKASGCTVHLLGNIGTPAIAALATIKADDKVVYELSSFQLQDLSVSPTVAVVLGITAEHQDYHGSIAEYVAAKANILHHQHDNDIAVIAVDYVVNEQLASNVHGKLVPISTKRVLEYGVGISEDSIISTLDGEQVPVLPIAAVRLPGRFNLENVVAAVAATLALGISPEVIAEVVVSFHGLPHRLEHIRDVAGVSYWNNSYATTPEATIAAVQSFTAPIVLLLGGSDKKLSYDELADVVVNSTVHTVVGIGESAPTLYAAIEAASVRQGKTSPKYVSGGETMASMVATASACATPGTVVLLSPAAASFDKFSNASERGDAFRAAVQALS